MVTIGIDPGKTGAVAVFKGKTLSGVYDCPLKLVEGKKSQFYEGEMFWILQREVVAEDGNNKNIQAIVESQHAFSQQGGVGNFTAGLGYGLWTMALLALGIHIKLVTSQAWRKVIFIEDERIYCNDGEMLAERKRRRKELSLQRARLICPEAEKMLMRKKDDGRAEAILIAYAGIMMMDTEKRLNKNDRSKKA